MNKHLNVNGILKHKNKATLFVVTNVVYTILFRFGKNFIGNK